MTSFPGPLPSQRISSVAPHSDTSPSLRTPRLTRYRSDTMLSTSSSTSSILQTPETPSILETLSAGLGPGIHIGPPKSQVDSPNGLRIRRRASSYEFGALWEESPGDHQAAKAGPSRLSVTDREWRLCDSPEEHDRDDYFSPAANMAPANFITYQPSTLPQKTQTEPEVPQIADPGITTTNPARPSTTRRMSSKLKDVVRLKLGRSKSSFKVLNRKTQHEEDEQASQSPYISSSNPSTTSRRQRLKSLISFSQSSNFSSLSLLARKCLGGIFECRVERAIGEACNEKIDPIEEELDRKGKGRAVHLPHPSLVQSQTPDFHNPVYDLSTPPLTQKLSFPLDPLCTEEAEEVKHVSFEESLPKELKLLVMKKLMESFANESFGRLSGELLGRMELIKMSTVSKSWEALCFDGQLWPTIDLAAVAHLLPVSIFHRILRHSASFISNLSLRGMDDIKGEMLIKALGGDNVDIMRYDYINRGPRLNVQRLDLSWCDTLTENDLASIIACCPNLRSLSLRGLSVVGSKLMYFLEKMETLEEIDISYCRALELPMLSSYIKRFSKVQADKLRSIRAAGLHYPSDMLLLSIMERCHNLERLNLQGCHDIGYARASSGAIVDLIKGCKKLRVLELDNTEANNSVMREFLRRRAYPCSRLSIIDCHNITQSAYAEIAASTRARQGWKGWAAVPFGYDNDVEMAERMVLKTFWGWKRVVVPKGWTEMRNEAEKMESRKRARLEQDACGSVGENSNGSKWKGDGKANAVDGECLVDFPFCSCKTHTSTDIYTYNCLAAMLTTH
ncbi:hypothetical protein I308_106281 [Cryptococcus tetragattii IND107]|uniref:F-box domain-containing protein n=1 Tax=Cryptococcus tetragattii IND107 TaxID=1296105 RepID=A0ABR3BIG5_9TREE